jgi:hypothetical protein
LPLLLLLLLLPCAAHCSPLQPTALIPMSVMSALMLLACVKKRVARENFRLSLLLLLSCIAHCADAHVCRVWLPTMAVWAAQLQGAAGRGGCACSF